MSVMPTIDAMQDAGFPMGGEPLAALDLVDTAILVVDPPRDLLSERPDAWWDLQSDRLPAGPRPPEAAVLRLRSAMRDLFDAHLEGRAPQATSVADVNAYAAAVPTSTQLKLGPDGPVAETRWHTELGGNAILAALAQEAIELLSDPDRLATLRRCASSSCSMLFLAENKRRIWCSSAGCGNRARAARHYHKTHRGSGDAR
ncbi:CGNR zinc finger domain-containing protein [Kribbella pittospori]|nr:ABATE domain-containing protein [Kribbella pittospori]